MLTGGSGLSLELLSYQGKWALRFGETVGESSWGATGPIPNSLL